MNDETAEQIAARVASAMSHSNAIDYDTGMPDKQYPEVTWSIYGLPESGEIAVVAEVASLRLGICAPSSLLYPPIADRVFGIDVSDAHLAGELADLLWSKRSSCLIAEALRLRAAGH